MGAPEQTYWSVEECRWVTLAAPEQVETADVPAQRDDEPAQEPVEA